MVLFIMKTTETIPALQKVVVNRRGYRFYITNTTCFYSYKNLRIKIIHYIVINYY